MDSKTYLEESARTASAQFHDEIVTPAMMEHALEQAIATGGMVDVVKKSLFYGRAIKSGSELEYFSGKPSELAVGAVSQDILHAALGIFTEATELLEAILAAMRGGNFDEVNAFEEQGDLEWYMAMLYRAINRTPEEAKQVNINKLRKRYPEKFESHLAINRDTQGERQLLEISLTAKIKI